MRVWFSACFGLFFCTSVAHAQQAVPESDAASAELQMLDRELTERAQQLGDWSQQHRLITDVINNIWTQKNSPRHAEKPTLMIHSLRMIILVGSRHESPFQMSGYLGNAYCAGAALQAGPRAPFNPRRFVALRFRL